MIGSMTRIGGVVGLLIDAISNFDSDYQYAGAILEFNFKI